MTNDQPDIVPDRGSASLRLIRDVPSDVWSRLWVVAFAVVYAPILYKVSQYGFWQHDSLHYLPSYGIENKFRSEGRWLNYYLADLITAMPPHAAWYLSFALLATFFHRVSASSLPGRFAPGMLTTVLMASPTIYAQLVAPYYSFSSLVLLCASAFLSARLSPWVLFPVASVLMFGGMSSYVYLLPLLYLRELKYGGVTVWHSFWRIVFPWCISFALGYAVAYGATWIRFGEGIQIAGWRRPTPARDLPGLLENLVVSAKSFAGYFEAFVPYFPWVLVAVLTMFVWQFLRSRPSTNTLHRALLSIALCIMVAAAHHVATTPSGISVSPRALTCMYVGTVFAILSLDLVLPRAVLALLVTAFVFPPAWQQSRAAVSWYAATTSPHA